jgi:hypothetical protein
MRRIAERNLRTRVIVIDYIIQYLVAVYKYKYGKKD